MSLNALYDSRDLILRVRNWLRCRNSLKSARRCTTKKRWPRKLGPKPTRRSKSTWLECPVHDLIVFVCCCFLEFNSLHLLGLAKFFFVLLLCNKVKADFPFYVFNARRELHNPSMFACHSAEHRSCANNSFAVSFIVLPSWFNFQLVSFRVSCNRFFWEFLLVLVRRQNSTSTSSSSWAWVTLKLRLFCARLSF